MEFTTTGTIDDTGPAENILPSESYDQIHCQVMILMWNDIIDNYDSSDCNYERIHYEMKHFENASNKEMEVSRDPGLFQFSVVLFFQKACLLLNQSPIGLEI